MILFDEYAENHGFSYEAVYYDTGTQILEALGVRMWMPLSTAIWNIT